MVGKLPKIDVIEPMIAFNDVEAETIRSSGIVPAPLATTDIEPPGEPDSSVAPDEDEPPPPSLWRRIVTSFTTSIFRRRSELLPPLRTRSALTSGGTATRPRTGCMRISLEEEVLLLLWRLDAHYLRAVLRLVDHILTARATGHAEFIRAQVLYLLAHCRRGDMIPLSLLRRRVHGVTRGALDATLLRLEAQGLLVLMPTSRASGLHERLAGIAHPTRGLLDHCALWDRQARDRGDTSAA